MKHEIRKAVCAVLAVILVCSTIASCGKNKEPADSLIASETYTEATVKAPDADTVTSLIREALGDESWDGDYASLTNAQKEKIINRFSELGYTVDVSKDGVVYFDYIPTADAEEIAEIVAEIAPKKEWDGQYASLTDEEKSDVQKALQKRGYDVDVGKTGFVFKNANVRKAETTRAEYNQLPTKDMLADLIERELGMDGYLKWDGSFLSLTEAQRQSIIKQLNEYGYNVDINDKGEMFIVHMPQNTLTFDTAYLGSVINGTTAPTTTIVVPENESATKEPKPTGTAPSQVYAAKTLERKGIKTFGGSGSDLFYQVQPTRDGGYIAVMTSTSKDGDLSGADAKWKQYIAAVFKLDKDYNVVWKDTIGNTALGVYLQQITQLSDGSFVAAGYATNNPNTTLHDAADALLVKYSANGDRLWSKTVRGSSDDSFYCIASMPDGGFIAGGQTKSGDEDFAALETGNNHAILCRFTADGDPVWTQSLRGGANATRIASVAVTDEGAIYAACQSSGAQLDVAEMAGLGSSAGIVLKYNTDGDLIKYRALDGSGADSINCLCVCSDGGVLAGGSFRGNDHDDSVFYGAQNRGNTDAYLVRLNAYLDVEWIKTYGGTGKDEILDVIEIDDGFVAVGESDSGDGFFSDLGAGNMDAFVLSVSRNGTESNLYALNGSKMDRGRTVALAGKKIIVGGATLSIDSTFTALSPAASGNMRIAYIAEYAIR